MDARLSKPIDPHALFAAVEGEMASELVPQPAASR